jgi:hypothetical protein
MERFLTFVDRHFAAMFLLAAFWGFINLAWRSYRHRQRVMVFPALHSVPIRFHEGMASGKSDKSFFSRLSGASRCLSVTVTDGEVWIRPFFPFYLITEADLEHRIARNSIACVRLVSSTFGRAVQLDFRPVDGKSRRLSLGLRNPDGFLAALNTPPVLPGQAES